MSFARDTARSGAQQAIYDSVKIVGGYLWLTWIVPRTAKWAQESVQMSARAAIAWAFLLCVFLLLAALFLFDWWRIRRKSLDTAISLDVAPTDDSEEWLRVVAGKDDREVENLLKSLGGYATEFFDGPEPYLEITVPVVNCSVFKMHLTDRVEGELAWNAHPLQVQPRILRPGLVIPHADYAKIVIRQHLSPVTAQQIAASADPWINTGQCAFFVNYEYQGRTKSARMGIAAQVPVRRPASMPIPARDRVRAISLFNYAPPGQHQPSVKDTITGQTYENHTVFLDDYRYVRRVFVNCTISWNGGDTELIDCKCVGVHTVGTKRSDLASYVALCAMFGTMHGLELERGKYPTP